MGFISNDTNINKKGRPKGSKNKKNKYTLDIISDILISGEEKFKEAFYKLEGRNFVNAYLSLLEYQLPKLARKPIEVDNNEVMDIPNIVIKVVDSSEIKNNKIQ